MSLSQIWNVAVLLFAPKAFARKAVEQDCQDSGEQDDYETQCQDGVAKKRKGIWSSFAWTFGICVAAASTAKLLNLFFRFGDEWIMSLRILSIAIIAWAVMSRLGDVQTWGGKTHLEKTSLSMFKLFYLIGLFIGIGSFFVNVN